MAAMLRHQITLPWEKRLRSRKTPVKYVPLKTDQKKRKRDGDDHSNIPPKGAKLSKDALDKIRNDVVNKLDRFPEFVGAYCDYNKMKVVANIQKKLMIFSDILKDSMMYVEFVKQTGHPFPMTASFSSVMCKRLDEPKEKAMTGTISARVIDKNGQNYYLTTAHSFTHEQVGSKYMRRSINKNNTTEVKFLVITHDESNKEVFVNLDFCERNVKYYIGAYPRDAKYPSDQWLVDALLIPCDSVKYQEECKQVDRSLSSMKCDFICSRNCPFIEDEVSVEKTGHKTWQTRSNILVRDHVGYKYEDLFGDKGGRVFIIRNQNGQNLGPFAQVGDSGSLITSQITPSSSSHRIENHALGLLSANHPDFSHYVDGPMEETNVIIGVWLKACLDALVSEYPELGSLRVSKSSRPAKRGFLKSCPQKNCCSNN